MANLPGWVNKHKVPGTEVRLLGGKYRLYKITSKWNSEKKRAQKITVAFLGTITRHQGLVKPKVTQVRESLSAKLSVLEHGAHVLVEALAKDVRAKLEEHFPDIWREIWVASQIRFIHQAPLKNWSYLYDHSYLSRSLSVKLSPKSCGSLLRRIGDDRDSIVKFLRSLAGSGHEHILVDTTHVVTRSSQVDIAKKGYNSSMSFEPQINLFYMFSLDTKIPVYYRMLPGNIREVSAMRLCVAESKQDNVILIGDKGFYSEQNVAALRAEGLRYILPLRRNNPLIDYDAIAAGDKRQLGGHFIFNKRPIWFVEISPEITLFLDEYLMLQESTDYLARLAENCEGYSEADYMKRQHQFGTIALASNIALRDPCQIYQRYKARGAIEQAFDSYKNLLDADTSYMHGTQQMEAWSFINFLALVFYYKAYNALLKAKLLATFSVSDLILRAREVKMISILNEWKRSEVSSKTAALLAKLDTPIT